MDPTGPEKETTIEPIIVPVPKRTPAPEREPEPVPVTVPVEPEKVPA